MKRKLGPKRWIEGAALDVMRAQLSELVKPGDWIRAGNYNDNFLPSEPSFYRWRWLRARANKDWEWKDGPSIGRRGQGALYWREIDAWAPKDGFK